MLRFLAIENLAVIERLEVEFEVGLNVLTGETGAGKSLLVASVSLLAGGRASPDLIRTGATTARVQATFETPDGREVLVRREITSQGRNRAFIDGTLVPAVALRERSVELVELHGQHEHQILLDPTSHLDLVDRFGRLETAAGQVAADFDRWQEIRARLDRAAMGDRERAARIELVTFQLQELERAAPRQGEDDELAATRQVLIHAEKLERLCRESYHDLYEKDDAILARLGQVWKRLDEVVALDPSFAPDLSRDTVRSELEELAFRLRGYASTLDASPDRLQATEERLAQLERLKRRYGPTLDDALARQRALRRELDELASGKETTEELEAAAAQARADFVAAATGLSARRREVADRLSRDLGGILEELALERSQWQVRFAEAVPESRWSGRGVDEAEFFMSANVGEELRPLARIASGGELSRIMLALRSLSAAAQLGKTLVFDEVDAGIGGRVAEVVGSRLSRLANGFQVLCISHLPQIAAYGACHFRVAKQVRAGRTITTLERLSPEARVEEIARMMGGSSITETIRRSAAELIGRAAGESEAAPKGESRRRGESERRKAKT